MKYVIMINHMHYMNMMMVLMILVTMDMENKYAFNNNFRYIIHNISNSIIFKKGLILNIKISKDLIWLEDYIDMVKHLIPNIKKLKRLSSKVPKKTLTEDQSCHGIITKYYNEVDHRITLYTKYLDMKLKNNKVELSIKPYSKIDTLCFLAHELSHLQNWDHTPNHKKLEVEITHIFMVYLAASGYISEEDETSYIKNCRR